MVRGVAEGELRRLRALEVEVQVVLPREADPAVELNPGARHLPVGVRDVRLGHRRREPGLGSVLVHRPRRVVRERLRVLDVHEHVRGLVLDALVGADRLAEGDADLRVLRRHLEDLLGAAAHLRAERDRGALEHARERGPGGVPGAEQRARVHGRVREGHLAELARLVHRRQERDARARGPPRDEEEAHAVLRARGLGRARGDDEHVGQVGVEDEELGAVEDEGVALRLGG